MNHQIYQDWLFEDAQDLSPLQAQSLQQHLEACEQCRSLSNAWHELETTLECDEMLLPAPGFALRWQKRLEDSQRRIYRRQVVRSLSLIIAGMALLAGLMLAGLWPWLRSPSLLFYTWVYRVFSIYTFADALRNLASPLMNLSTRAVPLAAMVFGFGFLCELAVLWVVSFRLLTNPRRITL